MTETTSSVLPNVPRTSIYHMGETILKLIEEFEKRNPGMRVEELGIIRFTTSTGKPNDILAVKPKVVIEL